MHVFGLASDKLLDVDASVEEFSVSRLSNAVYNLGGIDLGYSRKACEDSFALKVTKTALYVIFGVKL